MHLSEKDYSNERGLSCVFRQWRADSHCAFMHGYALGFKFTFGAERLDDRHWVVDFGKGGFGRIKEWLHYMFDHTVLIAEDDPLREVMVRHYEDNGLGQVRIVEATGCEATAKLVWEYADKIIREETKGRCWVEEVKVYEHGANAGIFKYLDQAGRNIINIILTGLAEAGVVLSSNTIGQLDRATKVKTAPIGVATPEMDGGTVTLPATPEMRGGTMLFGDGGKK